MSETSLLDLPDELLIRCLAGSGGMAIGAASVTCLRLHGLTIKLKQLPIFSSALSTHASLQHAIKDAAQRALIGCYGAVDFALLFVANYGSARGKKYSDPTDLGHAVEMLREALGQDAVIVGCACAGLMGVGADSQAVEVDPLAVHARGRRAAAARKRQGKPALPTKGVSVLLGKLPPGCVARAFAQDVTTGAGTWGPSTLPSSVPLPPQAAGTPLDWSWPLFDEALSLTSSQAAELMQHLQTSPTAAAAAAAQQPGSSCIADRQNAAQAPAVPAASTGEGSAAVAASADVAECQGLQRLSVAAAAAAASESAASPPDGVQLVPHMCLLLYDNMLQSFGYTESHDMSLALEYMAARGIMVVGGASSGAGDLFFSPGVQAARLSGEPPATPHIVGLLLCTAQAKAGAALQQAPNTRAACAAEMNTLPTGPPAAPAPADTPHSTLTESAAATASTVGSEDSARVPHTAAVGCREVVQSSSALQTAVLAALGAGPDSSAALFTDARVSLHSQTTMNADTIWICIKVDACAVAAPSAAGTDSKTGQEPAAVPADGAPSSATSAVRRSARLASSSSAPAPAAGASMTPMEQLLADLDAAVPVDDDDSDADPQYLAVWVCPKGHTPTAFTGEEAQAVVMELLSVQAHEGGPVVDIYLALSRLSFESLKQMISQPEPGSSICMQLVATKGEACAASVRQGLSQLLPLVTCCSGSPATATVGVGGAMHEYYAALQQVAAASGCRSGLQAVSVCSCTGRGQQLYAGEEDQEQGKTGAAYGEVCEAGLIDALAGGSVPFVGVYVSGELGPEVHNMCKGWYKPGQRPLAPAEMQGFTSMFAAWGCPPGSV